MDAVLGALVAGTLVQAIQPLVDRVARKKEAAASSDQPTIETSENPQEEFEGEYRRGRQGGGGELPALRLLPGLASIQELRALCLRRAKVMMLGALGRIPDLSHTQACIRKQGVLKKNYTNSKTSHSAMHRSFLPLSFLFFFAEVDPNTVPERAIRSVCCMVLLPTTETVANSHETCLSCGLMDNTLRKAKSRLESRGDDNHSSKFSPYTSMTHGRAHFCRKNICSRTSQSQNQRLSSEGEAESHGEAALTRPRQLDSNVQRSKGWGEINRGESQQSSVQVGWLCPFVQNNWRASWALRNNSCQQQWCQWACRADV